jgi:hypothetical protein
MEELNTGCSGFQGTACSAEPEVPKGVDGVIEVLRTKRGTGIDKGMGLTMYVGKNSDGRSVAPQPENGFLDLTTATSLRRVFRPRPGLDEKDAPGQRWCWTAKRGSSAEALFARGLCPLPVAVEGMGLMSLDDQQVVFSSAIGSKVKRIRLLPPGGAQSGNPP